MLPEEVPEAFEHGHGEMRLPIVRWTTEAPALPFALVLELAIEKRQYERNVPLKRWKGRPPGRRQPRGRVRHERIAQSRIGKQRNIACNQSIDVGRMIKR